MSGDGLWKKELRVSSVDDSAKKVTVVFGGAPTGVYDVLVESADFGMLDTTTNDIKIYS